MAPRAMEFNIVLSAGEIEFVFVPPSNMCVEFWNI